MGSGVGVAVGGDLLLIPITVSVGAAPTVCRDVVQRDLTFRELELQESHVEEFVRDNIGELFKQSDEDESEGETLLVVGQQVINEEQARADLVAIDSSGNLIVIEVKRDRADESARREPVEMQAVRYAASLATLRTPEELVNKLFTPYIQRLRGSESSGGPSDLTAREEAKRQLEGILHITGQSSSFNRKQRIILIGSGFSVQTLASVTWLSQNGVSISCYELVPVQIGQHRVFRFDKLAPPRAPEEFYVGFSARPLAATPTSSERTGALTRRMKGLPNMHALIEAGVLRAGEQLRIRGRGDDSAAVLQADGNVLYKGEKMSANQWGLRVTNFSAIQIYAYAENANGKLLNDLRAELANTQVDSAQLG